MVAIYIFYGDFNDGFLIHDSKKKRIIQMTKYPSHVHYPTVEGKNGKAVMYRLKFILISLTKYQY